MVDVTLSAARRYALDFRDDWTPFEQAWLATFTVVTLVLYWAWNDTLLGLVASLTGMVTVVLVAKGRIANYYFGIVNVALYGYIALGSQYYGEVMLNWGFFLPAQFVGLYLWTRNTSAPGLVRAVSLSTRERLAWGVGSLAAVGGYGLFLRWLNGSLPFFDATSTVLSVIAQVLMIRRATEQWVVWIVIDVVSIYMWLDVFLTDGTGVTMVVMWSAYLVNACYGWWNWRRMEGA